MRSLPLPVTLAVRLLPVTVLACVGWAWSTGPMAEPAGQEQHDAAPQSSSEPENPSSSVAAQTYAEPPAPCGTVSGKTVASLVPGAKAAGKELSATDESVRRGCSWSALEGYDYRWLDVSFEMKASDALAQQAFKSAGEDDKGTAQSGLGDEARLTTGLTTKDKQETREAVVTVRKGNALVTVTFNGSDFESKGAPSADTISKGALRAAGDAVGGLGSAENTDD
ncbi:hypothetical protein [Streptomyces longispororuber]|uniref:hypothetical protein n=1 Tax=Streptomyces longispororuber TaxID=68230 RepID=UPI00210B84A4|nr:hypothetical protein [Streptomyces longispororuber]MCQ4206257.1 hypothetical protein [Streptomyces longispororuber]